MSAETIAAVSAVIALVAAGGAWSAVLVNRWNATDTIKAQVNIGARNSRAAVVSANRQKWIDAIRDDVAEFIALRKLDVYRDIVAQTVGAAGASHADQMETLVVKERLLARIEMRLNWTGPNAEDDHKLLVQTLHRLSSGTGGEEDVKAAATKIFKFEWKRLKKEASGIDPFVQEAASEQVWDNAISRVLSPAGDQNDGAKHA